MKACITINMDNAAFDPEPATELARILKRVAADVENGLLDQGGGFTLRDINGNPVGRFEIKDGTQPRDDRTGKWHGNQMD